MTVPTPSEAWLTAHAPGFSQLPDPDRRAIFDFAFLWSLFESQVMGNFARPDRIAECVDAWTANGSLDAETYKTELGYFQHRYFAEGELTPHFKHLRLGKSDQPELVEAVIKGEKSSDRDKILVLILIVWRLRNNLFHGEKWAYEIRDQRDNFTQANAVLMALLDRHGNLA